MPQSKKNKRLYINLNIILTKFFHKYDIEVETYETETEYIFKAYLNMKSIKFLRLTALYSILHKHNFEITEIEADYNSIILIIEYIKENMYQEEEEKEKEETEEEEVKEIEKDTKKETEDIISFIKDMARTALETAKESQS